MIYTWQVTFDDVSKILTHIFNDRVIVVTDFGSQTITTVRDCKPFNKFSFGEMTVGDYEGFICKTIKWLNISKMPLKSTRNKYGTGFKRIART